MNRLFYILIILFNLNYIETFAQIGNHNLYSDTLSNKGFLFNSSNKDTFGYVELKIFENDNLVYNSMETPNDYKLLSKANLKNDSLILLELKSKSFRKFDKLLILISKDSYEISILDYECCIVEYNAYENDSLVALHSIPCERKNLNLIHKPTFKIAETVIGNFEFVSKDYLKLRDEPIVKYSIIIRGQFISKLESLKDFETNQIDE